MKKQDSKLHCTAVKGRYLVDIKGIMQLLLPEEEGVLRTCPSHVFSVRYPLKGSTKRGAKRHSG